MERRHPKRALPGWVAKEALPFVAASFASVEDISVTAKDCNLFIEYKPLLEVSSYVLPRVKLEFDARSSGEPSQKSSVVCDAAPYLEGVEFPQASPRVMLPSRISGRKQCSTCVLRARRARNQPSLQPTFLRSVWYAGCGACYVCTSGHANCSDRRDTQGLVLFGKGRVWDNASTTTTLSKGSSSLRPQKKLAQHCRKIMRR